MNRTSGAAERVLRRVDLVSTLLAVVGAAATVLLVGVTVVAVLFRYVFNDPIFGIDDISTMLLSVVVAGSIAYGGRVGAHVHVDVLDMVGGRRVTRLTDVLVRIFGIVIVGLTAFALIDQSLCGARCGYFTPNLAIPHLPLYWLIAAAMATYAVVLFLELVIGLFHIRAGRDPNEHH